MILKLYLYIFLVRNENHTTEMSSQDGYLGRRKGMNSSCLAQGQMKPQRSFEFHITREFLD